MRLGVGGQPLAKTDIVGERAMLTGTMRQFIHIKQVQLRTAIARYAKADGITGSRCGESCASGRVSKIAVAKLACLGKNALVSGSATMSVPTAAKRQTCGMNPAAILQRFGRHKKRTGQHQTPKLE